MQIHAQLAIGLVTDVCLVVLIKVKFKFNTVTISIYRVQLICSVRSRQALRGIHTARSVNAS